MRPRVLFLCTHNSARSQMAEGWLRHLAGDRFDVASAGTEATRVHSLAIRAMREVGIDLGAHHSKTLDTLLDHPWDYVITVCDSANERCPLFPGRTTRIHWSFDDPSQAPGDEDQRLQTFRRVRDEVQTRLRDWLADAGRAPVEVMRPWRLTIRLATLADAAAIADLQPGHRGADRDLRDGAAVGGADRGPAGREGRPLPDGRGRARRRGGGLGRRRALPGAGGLRGRRREPTRIDVRRQDRREPATEGQARL